MPGPKMGPRPPDFDEEIIRQSPTFARWTQLADGQKLKYACREFIKGHRDDEERLMRRIMIARRNNIRDHETLKKARKMQKQPHATTSRKAAAVNLQDHIVEREMDVSAVHATRSYKRWMALPEGAEFVYNQRYVKGKEGHDWLLKKNIWRRMRYRRENKRIVDSIKTVEATPGGGLQHLPDDNSNHTYSPPLPMDENHNHAPPSHPGALLHHHHLLHTAPEGMENLVDGLNHHHHNVSSTSMSDDRDSLLPSAAEEAAAAAAAAAAVDHFADQAAIEAAVAAAEHFGKTTNSENHHDASSAPNHHHHEMPHDNSANDNHHHHSLLVHDPLQAAAAQAALDAAARLAHISHPGLPQDENEHHQQHEDDDDDDGVVVDDDVTERLLLGDDDDDDDVDGINRALV